MDVFGWPALAAEGTLPAALACERAVWGKVHAAGSDFRWIARSRSFERVDPDLPGQLSLGAEDLPAIAHLWRNRDGWCYAAGLYPSRASDRSGRSNFLEKQVLAWQRPAAVPAALGALLLLPRVALSPEIWWQRYAGQPWEDPGFSLPLDPAAHAPVPVSEQDLAAAVERAIGALRERVPEGELVALYTRLLAGRRPACLSGLDRPLPPEALAALLLPLPRTRADALSIAGWLPSRRASLVDLGARWDLLVLPPPSPEMPEMPETNAAIAPVEADPETRKKAQDLAHALLSSAPGLAPVLFDRVSPAREAAPRGARVRPAPGQVPPKVAGLRPRRELALHTPPPGASPLLGEIHAFACTSDRRWLDPELLRRRLGPIRRVEEVPATLFPSWIETLAAQRPSYADREQWAVKVDLVRSAALVFEHRRGMSKRVWLPTSRRIPALLFACLLAERPPDLLGQLGEEQLKRALEQSLQCIPNRWTRRLRSRLEDGRRMPGSAETRVMKLIAKALDAYAPSEPVL